MSKTFVKTYPATLPPIPLPAMPSKNETVSILSFAFTLTLAPSILPPIIEAELSLINTFVIGTALTAAPTPVPEPARTTSCMLKLFSELTLTLFAFVIFVFLINDLTLLTIVLVFSIAVIEAPVPVPVAVNKIVFKLNESFEFKSTLPEIVESSIIEVVFPAYTLLIPVTPTAAVPEAAMPIAVS